MTIKNIKDKREKITVNGVKDCNNDCEVWITVRIDIDGCYRGTNAVITGLL